MVEGLAIKVPSNRWRTAIHTTPTRVFSHYAYHYDSDWDGTFKLECGCANPAYVLADLCNRARPEISEPDWVLQDSVGLLDWRMLYRWGCHCDELVATSGWEMVSARETRRWVGNPKISRPTVRCVVNAVCPTLEDERQLRETLRMHCLQWQSTDPRYRTSWPDIPYPKGRA